MKLPRQRKHAESPTKHHLFNKEFALASHYHRAARHMVAYQVTLPRHDHDRLEVVVNWLPPCDIQIARDLTDIGMSHEHRFDDVERLDWIVDDVLGIAQHSRPEISEQALEIATNFSATKGILELVRSMRPMR